MENKNCKLLCSYYHVFLFNLDQFISKFAIWLIIWMGLLERLVVGQIRRYPINDGELRHVHVVAIRVEQLRDDADIRQGYL